MNPFPSLGSEEELNQQLAAATSSIHHTTSLVSTRRADFHQQQQAVEAQRDFHQRSSSGALDESTVRSESSSSRSNFQTSPQQQHVDPLLARATPTKPCRELPATASSGALDKKRPSLMSRSLRGAYNFGKWAIQSALSTVKGTEGTTSPSMQPQVEEGTSPESGVARDAPRSGSLPSSSPRELANKKLAELAESFVLCNKVKIRVCTWNVALQAPDRCDLRKWVLQDLRDAGADDDDDQHEHGEGERATSTKIDVSGTMPDLVVVGLQEVELGGAAIIMEMTEASVAWTEAVTEALNKVASARKEKFYYFKLQHAQLVGMAQILIGRSDHVSYIANTKASVSRTGVMSGMVGNKGSIGIRTTFYGRRFLFICAHFHPHAHNGEKRCDNYHDALSSLNFSLPATADDELDVATMFAEASERKKFSRQASNASRTNAESSRSSGYSAWTRFFAPKADKSTAIDNEIKLLDSHDYVFFFGDLNFRLVKVDSATIRRHLEPSSSATTSDKDDDTIGRRQKQHFRDLLAFDELSDYVRQGKVFGTFAEPDISFPPTYKFDLNSDLYDTSVKRRDPAWTDRILYRCLLSSADAALRIQSSSAQKTPARQREDSKMGSLEVSPTPTPVVQWLGGSSDGGISEGFQKSWNVQRSPAGPAPDTPALTHPEGRRSDESQQPDTAYPPPPPFVPAPSAGRGSSLPAIHRRTSSVGSNGLPIGGSPSSIPFAAPFSAAQCSTTIIPFDIVPNNITVEAYDSCPSLKISDHRPVSAQFEVTVLQVDKEQLQRAMFELRELVPELGGQVDELAFV